MLSAAAVLACALNVLGRSENTFPPIEFVDVRPPEISPMTEAFVRRGTGTIYLLTTSAVFQEAARSRNGCGNLVRLKKLASILVHEEWHIRNGSDERGAYAAQLTTLTSLGLGPDSSVYYGVLRSMQRVIDGQNRARRAEALFASRELR